MVDNKARSENQAAPQTHDARLDWIKASRSYALGECVELAVDGQLIALRDSKDPEIQLRFTRAEMAAFLDGARRGEFDHLLS